MHPGHTDSPPPTDSAQTPTQPTLTDYHFRVTATVQASTVITISGPSREAAEASLRAQFSQRDSDVNDALGEDAQVYFRKHAQADDYHVEDAEDD